MRRLQSNKEIALQQIAQNIETKTNYWHKLLKLKLGQITKTRLLQQIALHYLLDIEFKDFMKFYKDYTKEPSLFLLNDKALSSSNLLRFRKTLL